MPANGRWDLIRRLKVNVRPFQRKKQGTKHPLSGNLY